MELIKTSLVWFGLVLALTLIVSAVPESGNKKTTGTGYVFLSDEERKAIHNNFSSEPHSPHFLVRATSKFSSFAYYVFLSF